MFDIDGPPQTPVVLPLVASVAVLAINDESLSSLSEEPQVLVRLSKMIFKTTKTKIVSPCVLESHYWANKNVTQIQRVIDQV